MIRTQPVGREAELAVLAGGLDAAAGGSGQLLTVSGDAGIGKSTLAAAVVARAHERGLTVLRAHAGPLDRDYPFGLARQAFAPLQAGPGWPGLCRGPAALGERVLTGREPLDSPYAATHGLFCLTAAVAARNPAVLVVDDAHWSDIASQHWLAALARRVDELPLTVVLTIDAASGVLGELMAGTVVALGPLAPATSSALLRSRFPDAAQSFLAACHAASGGNPYLLTALAAHSDGRSAPAVSPDEVARWVSLRLSRMPEGCAGLATGLAVLGPAARFLDTPDASAVRFPDAPTARLPDAPAASVVRFPDAPAARLPDALDARLPDSPAADGFRTAARLGDAASLAGLSPDRAAMCADALRAAGILAPDVWAPANPMIASALMQRLGAAERSRWHARAADLLAVRGTDPERTAVHLLRAEPAGRADVVALLRSAAARAAGRGAPESAAAYLRRALEEPPGDPVVDAAVRLDLALALAAVRQDGAPALAYEAVARITDPAARAEAALRCGRALAISAHGATAIAVCRLGLADTSADLAPSHPASPDLAHQPTLLDAAPGRALPADIAPHAVPADMAPHPAPADIAPNSPTPPDQGAGPSYRLVKDLAPQPVDNAAVDKTDSGSSVDNSRGGVAEALIWAHPTVRHEGGEGGMPVSSTIRTMPAATIARLEAEIAGAGGMDSRTKPMVRAYVERCRSDPPELPLWRVIVAIEDTFAGRAARDNLAVLRPLLESGVLAGEDDSVLPTVAGLALIANGDLDTARAMSERVADAAEARGWISTVAHGRFLRSLAVLPAGLVTEAVADARTAVEFKLSSNTPSEGLLFALCPLVDALVEADRLTEADALIAAAFPGEPSPYGLSSPMFLQSRGRLRWAQERPEQAIADLRAAGRLWDEMGIRHPGLASWRADLVAPLRATGAAAEKHAWEHLEVAERAEAPGPLSHALRVAATVAARERRVSLLERAVEVCAGTPERLARAYGLVSLGSALRRAGRREAARVPLRTGLEVAAAGGAHRLARLATAELHAAGARPRRAAIHGPAALTEAEQQVAGMAAGGLTNREIALRLVLSRRTIETHLAHAYHKLGIASRRDLGAALGSEGGGDQGP
ncbi:AAA family ATPase [Actinoplanes sp. LDG1-06]|uniref:AAA family ATPase n=1 Tax=Paractinoplanes ovalisporus TaxID=2810368 RepID=A0ABS2A7M5_9ACTN|nr:AAA family ATPase [Actinoplanes ovalisporus]MBM2615797.1 AAA family ATPase [Actinoplanes ovalisporus]